MEDQKFYKLPTLPNLTKEGGPHSTPKKIGPYIIDTLLSKGGMSYLYLGIHPKKETPIVIKVLSPKYLTHPEMVSNFIKESKIISITDHPNIIKLYGQGEWENGLYIAMEFVQGISLKQFILQQNLSIRSALEIILQVAYALLHLHTHEVIHRDLKPENILITEEGQVKVIDFGIAQLTSEITSSPFNERGRLIGTPSYMSPEQKKDPREVTYASDIYSLGVIMYELLLGKLSNGSIQVSLLPKGIQKIVEKALSPSVSGRYQDIVDLITDVTLYLKTNDPKELQEIGVKEIWTHLEKSHSSLLPKTCPKWPIFDIGLAKSKATYAFNFFHDFIRFSDQSYLFILAKLNLDHLEAFAYIALLKGMIQTLTREYLTSSDKHFSPLPFITSLNEMLSKGNKEYFFGCHVLHVLPQEDQFSYISCGFESLLHLPAESSSIRFLNNNNPLLGQDPNHQFLETTDNLNEGDLLLLHTFDMKNPKTFENELQTILFQNLQLSAQNQAEKVLEELSKTLKLSPDTSAKAILCIQRI